MTNLKQSPRATKEEPDTGAVQTSRHRLIIGGIMALLALVAIVIAIAAGGEGDDTSSAPQDVPEPAVQTEAPGAVATEESAAPAGEPESAAPVGEPETAVPLSESSRTPIDLAWTFTEAEGVDADVALALLAPNAVLDGQELDTEFLRLFYDWLAATGAGGEVDTCIERGTGDTTTVTCTYRTEDAWSKALGVDPGTGTNTYVVSGGEIVRVDHDVNVGDYHTQVFKVFSDWVRDNHPEDFSKLYFDDAGDIPSFAPEAIPLWEKFTAEFVEAVTPAETS